MIKYRSISQPTPVNYKCFYVEFNAYNRKYIHRLRPLYHSSDYVLVQWFYAQTYK